MLIGRKASIFSLVLNLIYALLWSAVGVATPIMGPTIYRPFSLWWHITVLEVVGVGLTIYFMATVSRHNFLLLDLSRKKSDNCSVDINYVPEGKAS